MEIHSKHSRLITIAACVLAIAVLHLARGVLIPFALAMLATFLLAPLVLRLQRLHINRFMAVMTAVGLVAVLSSAATWLLWDQGRQVVVTISEHKQNLHERMATLRGVMAIPLKAATKVVEDLSEGLALPAAASAPASAPVAQASNDDSGLLGWLSGNLGAAVEVLKTAALVLLFAFLMLLRRDDLGDRFIRLVGRGKILSTTRALEEAAKRMSGYLWRLLLINVLHGLAVGIGLALIGVPNPLLWGLVSAILRFIPYLGPWIAATFPVLSSLAVSPGWSQPLLTIGWYAVLELLSNSLLEPWIYGRGTGISPLAVIFSALFWSWLWGPVGLLLSTPLTVCLVVIGKHVPQLGFLQLLFGDSPGLSPPSRLYQRLLAGEHDQAWLVLRSELEKRPRHEVYDSILMPALALAEQDRQRGVLSPAAGARLEETVALLLEDAKDLRSPPDVNAAQVESEALAPAPLRVVCIPARGSADLIATAMLAQVLEGDGLQVDVVSFEQFIAGELGAHNASAVDAVCLSAAPPSHFVHLRHLCKRIAARCPKLPIIAGTWGVELDSPELADCSRILAGVEIVTSLDQARRQIRKVAGAAQALRSGSPPRLESRLVEGSFDTRQTELSPSGPL